MKLIFNQALKDLRLLRWLLAAWVLALVVAHGSLLYTASLGDADATSLVASSGFHSMIGMVGMAVLILFAALLVQRDSPVSSDAFWLTRPMSAGAMLASKLLVSIVVLVLLPSALEIGDYLVTGVGRRWLPPYRVPLQLAWTLPVLALAAVAADVPQFVLVALLEVVLLMAASGLAAAFGLPPAGNTHFDTFLALVTLASACVLAWQYLTRRRTVAAVFLAVAPFVLTLGIDLWPWQAETPVAYPEEKRKAISVAADREAIASVLLGGDRVIQIPLTVTGKPPNTGLGLVYNSVHVWLQQAGSRTRFDIGAVFTNVRPGAEALEDAPLAPDSPETRALARVLDSALAGTALMNAQVTTLGALRPAIAFFVRRADLRRLAGTTGTLHLEFDLMAQEYGAYPGVPIATGTRYDGPALRATIVADRRTRYAISLDLRETASGWHVPESYSTHFLLRNRAAGQSLLKIAGWAIGRSNYGELGMILPLAPSLVVRWRTLGFGRVRGQTFVQTFASHEEARRWAKDAELVVIPTRDAGQFHVVLELPEFKVGG
jgi:hypothetical protein